MKHYERLIRFRNLINHLAIRYAEIEEDENYDFFPFCLSLVGSLTCSLVRFFSVDRKNNYEMRFFSKFFSHINNNCKLFLSHLSVMEQWKTHFRNASKQQIPTVCVCMWVSFHENLFPSLFLIFHNKQLKAWAEEHVAERPQKSRAVSQINSTRNEAINSAV